MIIGILPDCTSHAVRSIGSLVPRPSCLQFLIAHRMQKESKNRALMYSKQLEIGGEEGLGAKLGQKRRLALQN